MRNVEDFMKVVFLADDDIISIQKRERALSSSSGQLTSELVLLVLNYNFTILLQCVKFQLGKKLFIVI